MSKKIQNLLFVSLIIFFWTTNIVACLSQKNFPKDYPYSESCCKKCKKIVTDERLDSIQKKLGEWKKYQFVCAKDGGYEHYIAEIYGYYHEIDKSIEVLENAIKNPDYNIIENASLLGFEYYYKGMNQKLFKIGNMLVQKYPKYPNGYSLLGIYYITLEDFDKALESLQKAYEIKLFKGEVLSAAYLSTVYYEFERDEDVVKLYYEAYNRMPKETILQRRPTTTMIASLINLDRLDEAQKLFGEWEKYDYGLKDSKDYHTIKKILEDALKQK